MNTINKYIKESDVIIYNLDECSPDEIEFALKVLSFSDIMAPKTLILISSVLSWSRNNLDLTFSEPVPEYDDS